MPREATRYLVQQFDTAWKLASYHLEDLTTDECLWRPAHRGPHVHRGADGIWDADWPEHEGYDLGPPSIAWITWHMGFWWQMVLDHAFANGTLTREDVSWPGTADRVRQWLTGFRDDWRSHVEELTDDDLRSTSRSRWPYRDRPFGDVVAWVNIELAKNAAEIGFARFLFAATSRGSVSRGS